MPMTETKNHSSTQGMVVTAFPLATRAGAAMLKQGGNAIDAAMAAAWALAVCEPGNSGVGGQTVMLAHFATGETTILDGCARAPAAASPSRLSLEQQRTGHRACTTPTTPAVLEMAQARWGRLKREQVLEPALELAANGYTMTELQHRQLLWCLKGLSASESASALFLKKKKPYNPGELFRQPQLAKALERMIRYGTDDFYHGEIAHAIANDMQANQGLVSLDDLATVQPQELPPLSMDFHFGTMRTAPPPAGGFLLLLGLKIIESLRQKGAFSSEVSRWYETLGEVTWSVFNEREQISKRLSHFQNERLLEMIEKRANEIAQGLFSSTMPPEHLNTREEPGETTHLCAVDAEGNIVSLTQSLQSLYGSRAACTEHGILYNNYLVTCPREPHPYQLGSHCQPRSNSAPSLILFPEPVSPESTAPYLTFGATGSRRSVSAALTLLSAMLDRGLSLPEAIALPRLHVKLSRNAWLESSDFARELAGQLRHRFTSIEMRKHHSYAMGCAQAIHRTENNELIGAADPRREGTAERVEMA